MTNNHGFGYQLNGITTELFNQATVSGLLELEVNLDNKTYSFTVNGYNSGDIPFDDSSVSKFDNIRFFLNQVNGERVDVYFDNIKIKRPVF